MRVTIPSLADFFFSSLWREVFCGKSPSPVKGEGKEKRIKGEGKEKSQGRERKCRVLPSRVSLVIPEIFNRESTSPVVIPEILNRESMFLLFLSGTV